MSIRKQFASLWLGRSRAARWGRALALAALVPPVASLLGELRFFRIVELKTEDLRFRERGPRPIHPDLLVLEIDDKTIQQYGGRFPLPRSQHAYLLRGLMEAGAASVGLDMLFPTPAAEPDDDRLLAEMMRRYAARVVMAIHFPEASPQTPSASDSKLPPALFREPPVALPESLLTHGSFPGVYRGEVPVVSPEPYRSCGAGIGHITLLQDLEPDGSLRQVPLFLQTGSSLVPALALACWLQRQGLRAADVRVDSESGWLLRTNGTRLLPLSPHTLHEVDFSGDVPVFAPQRMSYVDAIGLVYRANRDSATPDAEAEVKRRFGGKNVLVGLTAQSSYALDHGSTPVSSTMPLLYLHASLLNDLLRGQSVRRLPVAASLLLASFLLFVGAGVGPRLHPAMWLALTLSILLGIFVFAQLVFNASSIMLGLIPPLLTLVLGSVAAATFAYLAEEREREILRRTFDRYVSSELMEGILANAGDIELGGALREATVLFLDIRGFTAWTRSTDPQELVQELNALLSEMVNGIFAQGGAVNKFLGDAILAVFGAPITHSDDACRAVRTAQDLHLRLAKHNRVRADSGKPPIHLGIGIASGPVVAGNIGSSERLEFTVMGHAVNLASRLQALSSDGQILVDRATADLVRENLVELQLRPRGSHQVKGIDEPVEVFEVAMSPGGPSEVGAGAL